MSEVRPAAGRCARGSARGSHSGRRRATIGCTGDGHGHVVVATGVTRPGDPGGSGFGRVEPACRPAAAAGTRAAAARCRCDDRGDGGKSAAARGAGAEKDRKREGRASRGNDRRHARLECTRSDCDHAARAAWQAQTRAGACASARSASNSASGAQAPAPRAGRLVDFAAAGLAHASGGGPCAQGRKGGITGDTCLRSARGIGAQPRTQPAPCRGYDARNVHRRTGCPLGRGRRGGIADTGRRKRTNAQPRKCSLANRAHLDSC